MKISKIFLIFLSLFLITGLTMGCDSGDEETTTTTPTTPTTPGAPTCSISPDPQIVRYGETSKLNITITGGPANGSFSPSSGECGSFTNSSGTSCNTASITTPGENTFTLTVAGTGGSNSCTAKVYIGCQDYRVWNNTGSSHDFTVDGTCSNDIANGSELTTTTLRLNVGETITRHTPNFWPLSDCSGSSAATLTYDNAMNRDSKATGGDGDCQVYFTDTGGSDR